MVSRASPFLRIGSNRTSRWGFQFLLRKKRGPTSQAFAQCQPLQRLPNAPGFPPFVLLLLDPIESFPTSKTVVPWNRTLTNTLFLSLIFLADLFLSSSRATDLDLPGEERTPTCKPAALATSNPSADDPIVPACAARGFQCIQ